MTRRRRERRGNWLPRLLILTALLAIGLAGFAWYALRRSVPALEGQLKLAGLAAPVEVLFDQAAIPHIYARDAEDAWLVLGYLHGRERLWQMELYRRAAGGRLSEVLGEATLRVDKRFIGLGLRRAAADEWKTATPIVRQALERYSIGVNLAIEGLGRFERPPEFLALGISPEPWTPVDSLAVARLLSWRLAENRMGELVRGRLTSAVGSASADRLMGVWPSGAPTILAPKVAGPQPRLAAPPAGGAASMAAPVSVVAGAELPPGLRWLDVWTRAGGSNSWVVAPSRTATGRPLLANDPHLAVEMPSIW